MKPTFEKTVDVLVRAYFNGTLEATNCQRCAVGNIISGGNPDYNFYKHGASWYRAAGLNVGHPADFDPTHPDIVSTGYTINEIIRIEGAFLYRDNPDRYSDDNFDRLMDVVNVLADIHGIDLEKKEAAKLLFVKA